MLRLSCEGQTDVWEQFSDNSYLSAILDQQGLMVADITWDGPSRGAGEREIFKAFRKKTFFALVCMYVLHHVHKNDLCSMSVLKFG